MTIQSRVPAADYFARPALNISRLKELRRSPQHYRYFADNPKTTKPMTLGTAAHCATLEPERFCRDYAIWSRRTAAGKMAPRSGSVWDAFVAEQAPREILTEDEASLAMAMSAAVRNDPIAMKYLAEGDPEVTMEWEIAGRPCKGRADWLTTIDGEPFIVGLKTARDCRPFVFATAAAKLGYAEQWAWYYDGYRTITGRTPHMIEIVVESAPPHAVVTYLIPNEDVIAQGRENYLNLLRQLEDCERLDYWPGPAQTELVLSLPSWFYGTDEDVGEIDLET